MPLLIPLLKTTVMAGSVFAVGWWVASRMTPGRASEARPERGGIKVVSEATLASSPSAIEEREGQERAEFVAHLRDGVKRLDPGELDAWARAVAVAELEAVIAALGSSPEPTWAIRLLVSRLASRDPAAALRCFEGWGSFGRFQLVRSVVAGWASADPKAALSWLASQPTNAATDEAREAALSRWAADNPEEALAAFRENGWQWDSPQAMRGMFRVWAQHDPKAAMDQWRRLNEELNPPVSPQATPPLPPFTATLVGEILERADATQKPEAVAEILDSLDPRELAQLGARFWFRWLSRRDLATYLPMLEERMSLEKMQEVVQFSGSLMLDRADEMRAAIRNPELRRAVPVPHPPATPPFMPGELESRRTSQGTPPDGSGGFWTEPLKLDP